MLNSVSSLIFSLLLFLSYLFWHCKSVVSRILYVSVC